VCKFDADTQKSSAAEYRELQIKRSRVLITGYEAIRMHSKQFIRNPFSVVIFDEATKLKNHKSGVSKEAAKFIHSLPYGSVVIPMSGTFIENKIEELYSIMDIVDPRVLGGFHNFEAQYLVTDWQGNVVGYRNEKKLKKKLDHMLIRRTVDEVWKDRPPLIESIIECPMGKEQMKVYMDARQAKLKEIEDIQKAKKINMSDIAPLIGYLLQIACTIKAVDPDTKVKKHSSKIDTLCEMVKEEFPRKCKIVIFSHYANNVIPYIVEELEALKMGGVAKIVGGVSDKAQARTIKRFKENDQLRFLVCSDAMAYGANLQFCNYVINFDLPWNPAVLDQRIRRAYRRGQKKTVTVINFIVPGTITEHRHQVIEQKRKLFGMFLKESVVAQRGKKKVDVKEMIKHI
jgi:SNF2 family DNA or RNA helicase